MVFKQSSVRRSKTLWEISKVSLKSTMETKDTLTGIRPQFDSLTGKPEDFVICFFTNRTETTTL